MTTPSDKELRRRREGVVRYGFRDSQYGTEFIIDYVFLTTHWGIRVVGRPRTSYAMSAASVHLLGGNYVCVAIGHEPKTFAQALARSFQWMRGFSAFTQTGRFLEVSGPVNVPDHLL
ncbi:MAG: hypothetical protein U0871_15295 [Gemmataceae bacterium]